jgi:hypothetical protein
LFLADSLVRHLLRLARGDSSVSTMDRTYLRELVRDMPPLCDQRTKSTTTGTSNRNFGMK